MNYWKLLAVLFTIFSFGAIRETIRILTSHDQGMIPISLILTFGFIVATLFFWRKARKKNLL